MLSSLQLRSASFLEFSLLTSETGTFEGEAAFGQNLKFGLVDEKKRLWRVELCVEVKNNPKKPFAYGGTFRAVAIIEVHPSFPAEKMAESVEAHGATLLYGVIREMVANVSSRSAKGLFLLPTLNFQAILRKGRQEALSKKPAKSRK